MDWYIHHVNIPAINVSETRNFFRNVLGFSLGEWTYPDRPGDLHHDDDSIAYFGTANRGIHVVRPIPTFAVDNGFFHNPTVGGHFAITVPNLQDVMARLDTAGIIYSDAKVYAMAGVHQIYVYDPSMNVIEINAIASPSGGAPPQSGDRPGQRREPGAAPGDWAIHHVTIPAHDVVESVAFFRDLVGLPLGRWQYPDGEAVGNFDRADNKIAIFGEQNRGIHIVKPVASFAFDNGFKHNPTIGGHKAFAVQDVGAVIERLTNAGIDFTDAGVYAMNGVRQVYTYDPSGNFIEINDALN